VKGLICDLEHQQASWINWNSWYPVGFGMAEKPMGGPRNGTSAGVEVGKQAGLSGGMCHVICY